jgi:hypothetical protein
VLQLSDVGALGISALRRSRFLVARSLRLLTGLPCPRGIVQRPSESLGFCWFRSEFIADSSLSASLAVGYQGREIGSQTCLKVSLWRAAIRSMTLERPNRQLAVDERLRLKQSKSHSKHESNENWTNRAA